MKRCGPAVVAAICGALSCAHRPPMTIQMTTSSCRQVVPAPAVAVTWIAPNHPRDIARHRDWCTTVGPVLVESPEGGGPDSLPGASGTSGFTGAPASTDGRFAIVSWNVQVGGGDVEGFVARLRRGDFTGGAAVTDFALLLQEAYREGPDVPATVPDEAPVPRRIREHSPDGTRRDIRAVAQRAALYLFYAPSMRNGNTVEPEDRGTAILSTLPLVDLQVIELPFERQRRVALAATIAGGSGASVPWRLRVADVHVDTTLALTRGGPFAARKRQAEALIDALTVGGADSRLPMVVGGDFNTWLGPKEPALDVMRRAFPDTPRPANLIMPATWRGPLGTGATLDYVFVRGGLKGVTTRRLPDRFGSDHYPLLTLVGTGQGSVAQRLGLEFVE